LLKKILGYLEMTLQMQISENRAIEGSNRAIEGCCVSSPGAQRSYRSFATWTMGCSNLFASWQGSAPHTQSLWVSADGYFYALYIIPADVSHKSFKTPTMFIKAAG
jgi:hypothetical protein